MERMGVYFRIFLTFFSIFCSSVLSRTLPVGSNTVVFDVSSTLSKTQDLFSQNLIHSKHQVRRQHHIVSSDSSPSFQLHSRLAVRGTSDKDYRTLILARFARDLALVKALQTRLDLLSLGIKKTDITPLEVELEDDKKEVW